MENIFAQNSHLYHFLSPFCSVPGSIHKASIIQYEEKILNILYLTENGYRRKMMKEFTLLFDPNTSSAQHTSSAPFARARLLCRI